MLLEDHSTAYLGDVFIENTWFLSVEATIAKFGVSDNEHMQCWAPPEPQMKPLL